MTYNVFGGTLNPVQSSPDTVDKEGHPSISLLTTCFS